MTESILRTYPEARNSDAVLYSKLINEFRHCGLTQEQILIMQTVPFESVTRVRREIQANGKYLAEQEVQQERADKCAKITAQYGSWRKYLEAVMEKNKQKILQEQNDLPF